MKKRITLILTIAAFLAPVAPSQAFMGLPKNLKAHDNSVRTNDIGSQANGFSKILHRVGIVDEESGQVVSNDPDNIDAQVAETSGQGWYCGKNMGNLNIVERNGRFF